MSLTTYAGLQASVAALLTRTDTATYVADWITLAEARIGRELRVDQMLARSTASLSSEFMAVPTDFLAAKSMRLTSGTKALLQFMTTEQLTLAQETPGCTPVKAYARIGGQFWFYPAPTSGVAVELIYWAAIPALSNANTSNWLLLSAPDAYLRATMMEAALFYEDDTLLGNYAQLFTDSIGAIKAAAVRDGMASNLNTSPSSFTV